MTQIVEVIQGGQATQVEFPDDMSPESIEEVLRREFPSAPATQQGFSLSGVPSQPDVVDDPSARDSTIGEEWTRGVERLKIDYPAFAQSFSDPEEAALEAIAKGDEVAARLGRPATMADVMTAYEEEGFVGAGGEVLQAIPRVVASQAPNTLASMAGAFGGSRLVGGLSRLLGAVPHPAAKIAGGVIGAGSAILPQLFSQNIQRQAETDIAEGRPVEIDTESAALAAAAQTAAEGFGTYMTFGRSIISRILGITPKPRGVRSSSFLVNLAQDSLKGAVRGAAVEIPTEISQQIIERAQAGLDVMSDEAYAEYGEAAYMAGIAGGTLGGVSGAATPIFTPTQTPPEDLPGDLPTTADLSEITPETVTPDLPDTEPTTDIAGEDAVSRLKNLGEAYDEDARRARVKEQLEVIAPNLRGVLKGRGLDDIGINVAYNLDPQVLSRMDDPQEVEALFDPSTRTILLGADRVRGFEQLDTPQLQREFGGLVDHEMVHAVKRMKLWTDAEWGVLENVSRRQINADGVNYLQAAQDSYLNESPDIQQEEAVAELIRDTLAGRTGLAGQPLNLMQRLIEFFRKMGNALTGTGYASFNQVVNDIDSGVLGGRTRGGREAVRRLDNLGRATPVATPMIGGSPALASRKKAGYLRSVEASRAANEGDVDFSKHYLTERLNIPKGVYVSEGGDIGGGRLTATRTHRGKSGGSGSTDYIGEINYSDELARRGRKSYVVKDANFQPLGTFSTEQEALDALAIKGRVSDQVADQVGEPMYPPGSGLSPNFSYKDEDFYGPEAPVSLEGGATLISEDALRQTLDKEIARLKPDVQAQQELPLPEGMTGAEVAAEELRVAEQTQMQEQARAGVGEARSILEDDQQPLAARRQQTAKGLRALGDVPRPPRDAGWEQRAKEQGFDTGRVLYHSTSQFEFGGKEFERFIPSAAGKLGPGVYTSSEPDYTQRYISGGINADGARTIPVFARGRIANEEDYQKALELAEYDDRTRTTDPMHLRVNPDARSNLLIKRVAKQILQDQGFTGIERQFRNGSEVVIFDPKNLRSIHANFDPARTESTDLLASRKLKTKPEDSAALAEDKSKGATEVRGNPEADRAAADELRKVKTLASRDKPSDIVESTAYNRVADVASTRASRGQGNINNALPFEAPSSADDRGFVYQVQDKYVDLKKAIGQVIKSRGKQGLTPLLETENPYLGEESMHGIIGNKFNRFEQDEVKPLADKLIGRNITRQELEEFLVLRHAIERNAHVRKLNAASKEPRADLQDGGAGSLNGQRLLDDYVKQQMQSKYGMTWNDSTQSWEGGNRNAAIMNDLANDFDAITRGTLQELKDSGLINQDSLNKLQGYYKYYAPLRGVSPDEDVAIEEHARLSKSSNNLSIKGVETEKTKGRVSEASPPLGQIIFQRQNAIRRGTINDVVGQRMLNVIRENPNDNYWKIHTDRKYADVTGTELLGVKEGGEQFFIEFKDPRLREAMLSLDGVQSGKIVGMLRYVNRILSAVNTSLNPEFMFGNFFRDLGTAMGNVVGEQTMVDGKAIDTKGLKRAIIADTVPSIRQVYRGLRGKKLSGKLAQDWKEYLESGAKTEWFYVKSPEESAATFDQLTEMSQGTFKGNVQTGKKAVANLIEDTNGAVENGVRFAVFKKARDAFIKNGLSRELAVAKAATLSKNLTVNFNRMGNRGELLNGLYLFFNASVQGTANFLRGMSSPAKQRMLLAMVSFGALITRMNELSSEEDEDLGESYYSQIEPWVKERNLVIMKSMVPGYDGPPELYYTIPLPYGYNVLHVLGVNIAENMMGIESVQDSAGELVAASLGSFMPVGFGSSENPLTFVGKGIAPQIGKPFVEIAVNENFFGSPVYTENFDFGPNIPAAYRAKQSTPEIFKNTTRFLNELTQGNESMGGDVIDLGWISPDVLDHFFNTITGGLGATVERSGKAIGAGRDYLQGDYVEGDITVNDIPFVRRAVREVTGRESQSQYYDRRDDIYAYDRQLNLLRGAERGAFVRENRPRLLMKRLMDSSDKRLRNINTRLATIRDRILTSTSMENTIRLEEEEKRLQDLKQSTYDRFNKRFNDRVGRTE